MAKIVPRIPKEQLRSEVDDDEPTGSVEHTDEEPVIESESPAPVDESPDPVEASEDSVEAAAEAEIGGIRGFLASRGLTQFRDAESDEAAVEALLGATSQYTEALRRQAQQAQQQAAYYAQQQQQYAQQYAQAQQQAASGHPVGPAPQAPAKSKWEAPEYDPGWRSMLVPDENGNIVAKPGADPTLPAKYAKWVQHQQKVAERLAKDPGGFLEELGYVPWETAQQRLAEQMQGWQEQFYRQQVINQKMQAQLPWMVEHDQNGTPVIDPATGTYRPTEYGNNLWWYLQEAQQRGIQSEEAQIDYAVRSVHALYAHRGAQQPQQTAQQAAQMTQQQKNLEYQRQQATRKASQTGTRERPERGNRPAQNGRPLEFVERAKRAFAQAGVDWNSEAE